MLFGALPCAGSASAEPAFSSAPELPEVSDAGAAWVRAALCRDAAARPSAADLRRHPSFVAPWTSQGSLMPTLAAARACGALGVAADADASRLDALLAKLNAQARARRGNALKERDSSESTSAGPESSRKG